MEETNGHIAYLKDLPLRESENTERAIRMFTEFKFEILQHQYRSDLLIRDEEIKVLERKSKKLEEELQMMKENAAAKQNTEDDIMLTTPLVVKAHLMGSRKETCHMLFDDSYTNYHKLYEKIQTTFHLESDILELAFDNAENDNKQLPASDQYRASIEKAMAQRPADIPVSVILIYVTTKTDELENEFDTTDTDLFVDDAAAAEKSTNDSEQFSEISMPDSPLANLKREDCTTNFLDSITDEVLPYNGYEELAFATYHWTVPNWDCIRWKIRSDGFDVGGRKWYIDLYPKGRKGSKHVSIYLKIGDSDIEDWKVCAEFALVISNPDDPASYYSKYFYHPFIKADSNWGTSKFYPVIKMTESSDRWLPLLVDNKCIVSAYVRVVSQQEANPVNDGL
ncbi:hypothetical protein DFQ28_001397 [Apophysomyces sp. BC1034]|nr:hypothetical protein DFQ28_001397 [Apophysomyces sp. BC1034]